MCPIFEYLCENKKCGLTTEIIEKYSDKTEKCPNCGKKQFHRILSGGNFLLKGEGFYNPSLGNMNLQD